MKKVLLLLMALLVFWSCSSSLPDWYKNRKEYFPEDKFITAEGWGETPEKAIENATINMARIFNVNVSVEENILNRYASISNMKDFEEYYEEFSEETATLITKQNLINIMFVDPAYDRKSRSYFTLSYFDIFKTARILMDRMEREQETMEYYIRMAQGNTDPVVKYHYYTSAWLTSANIKMMQEQLDILAPGMGIKPIYSYSELEDQKNKAAEQIKFKIEVSGDSNGRIKQALRTIVNQAGFTAVEQDATLNLNAKTNIRKIDIDQDKLAFVSWEIHLKMDRKEGESAISLMEEGREGSTNYQNANLHAYENMQDFIETEFRDQLNAYFDTMKK